MTRSQQMLGFDSNYVPGWDCHGLPIEWKIEEEYRAKGKNKDAIPINEFRQGMPRLRRSTGSTCRCAEFKRLGVEGDWDHPYSTMRFPAEAQIAREMMKFAQNGTLYRGSKPVMWSVVEKTALAEAEVEYEDYHERHGVGEVSGQARARGKRHKELEKKYDGASVVIWTTTPWTLPGNRAISYSPKIAYGLYKVTDAAPDNWAKFGDLFILSENLAGDVFKQARVTAYDKIADVPAAGPCRCSAAVIRCASWATTSSCRCSPAITSPTIPAPASCIPRPDTAARTSKSGPRMRANSKRAASTRTSPTPSTRTAPSPTQAPGFTGKRVINDKGEKGDANDAVIKALAEAGNIIARGRLKHQYPHSWRSKKPVIFRNTPQWFIAMDKPIIARRPIRTQHATVAADRAITLRIAR